MLYYLFNVHYSLYISFLSFSYINVLGFLLFITFLLQLFTGILLSIYYNAFFTIAADSIISIIINTNNGWFIRLSHVIAASLFILQVLLHFIRAIWIKLRIIDIKLISLLVLVSGYLLFILCMIEGLLGYLLCWGQMSYWGITVMINILSVLPWFGVVIGELIWSSAIVILNRIFVYHFIIGMLIGNVILFHIVSLHNFSSSNPFINNNTLIISFYPFIFKDLYSSLMMIAIAISVLLYFHPDILGNSDNEIIANPLITPNNILPEWYYLLFYCCLRSFPNKRIGVVVVFNLVLVLISCSTW